MVNHPFQSDDYEQVTQNRTICGSTVTMIGQSQFFSKVSRALYQYLYVTAIPLKYSMCNCHQMS